MILNCITIDDEPIALELLNDFVAQTPFLKLTASFGSAKEALERLQDPDIHLVFLDIQMPKLNGIEIARLLSQSENALIPRIIFTTAYHHFAVESYRLDALDYLLKPFEYEDFERSAKKALQFYQLRKVQKVTDEQDECIFVRVEYRLVKILWEDIRYIESLKDYIKIHLIHSDKPVMTLATLKSLAEKLPAQKFMRIQRSFIVALDKITILTKNSVWIGDIEITIGAQYKPALSMMMNKWL